MRKNLLCLILILSFCGCAFAEENPFSQVIMNVEAVRTGVASFNPEEAKAVAQLLQSVYAGDFAEELVQMEDGLGGVIVSDPASEGVYYIPDTERYEKVVKKMTERYMDRLESVLFLLVSFLIVCTGYSIYLVSRLGKAKYPDYLRKPSLYVSILMSIFSFCGFCIFGLYHNDVLMDKESSSPTIVRAVLQNRPESVEAEFYSYSKGQIEKLITEYAARYDNNMLEERN